MVVCLQLAVGVSQEPSVECRAGILRLEPQVVQAEILGQVEEGVMLQDMMVARGEVPVSAAAGAELQLCLVGERLAVETLLILALIPPH